MKVHIGLEKTLFSLILYYHVIIILIATVMPNMTMRIVQLFLIVLYIYFIRRVQSRKIFIGVNALLAFYIVYNAVNFHIEQIIHSDFYTFVLLGLIFVVYGSEQFTIRFYKFFKERYKEYLISEIVFFAILMYTILFKEGLQFGIGVSLPLLYGPFEVPHMLGYMLIAMYCGNAFFLRKTSKRIFLVLKCICVFLVLWTAARSAVLGLSIVILADYASIRNYNRRFLVVGWVAIVALYMFLFTDSMTNNPLLQKTLSAMEKGSITNGRSQFAELALNYYTSSTSFTEKMFGIGMNNVRNIFLRCSTIRAGIHVHNDYLNALVGYGLLGMGLYVFGQLKQAKVINGLFNKFVLVFLIFVLAYFNGFAMYAMFTPSLIIIYVFLNQRFYIEKFDVDDQLSG